MDIIEVIWRDALGGRGWESSLVVSDPEDEFRTVGYMVGESDAFLTVAQNIQLLDNELQQIGCLMHIPKGCIINVRKINNRHKRSKRSKNS